MKAKLGIDFSYLEKLHYCLKKMVREVINSEDKANQQYYLKKTYEWYTKQQCAVGLIDPEQAAKEHDFLNPGLVAEKMSIKKAEEEKKRLDYMDDIKHETYKR